ncbi:hypothetical protein KIPB_008344, partial [Kipferlia bialata]|eukprot:g8344.t1
MSDLFQYAQTRVEEILSDQACPSIVFCGSCNATKEGLHHALTGESLSTSGSSVYYSRRSVTHPETGQTPKTGDTPTGRVYKAFGEASKGGQQVDVDLHALGSSQDMISCLPSVCAVGQTSVVVLCIDCTDAAESHHLVSLYVKAEQDRRMAQHRSNEATDAPDRHYVLVASGLNTLNPQPLSLCIGSLRVAAGVLGAPLYSMETEDGVADE